MLLVHFLSGAFPKPILRIQPDSVVYKQTKVTFLCEGTTEVKEYHLYKDGYKYLKTTGIPQNPKGKTEFSISKIGPEEAGRYSCRYGTRHGWSEYSDSLELVVTGERKLGASRLRIDCQEMVVCTGMSPHSQSYRIMKSERHLSDSSFSPRNLRETQSVSPAQPCGE